MAAMKAIGKAIGIDHALALELWETGIYEARTVAGLIADPAELTAEQMDLWAHDFDSWAIVDSICFNLYDRSGGLAWDAVDRWAASDVEMVKRAAFLLLWGLARHDRSVDDEAFGPSLVLIERSAGDGRPLVDKAIDMALRAIGRSRPGVAAEARAVAARLAASDDPARRRVGRKAAKGLGPP
jgi:3-methyladenine DNA glycosylase AlkD